MWHDLCGLQTDEVQATVVTVLHPWPFFPWKYFALTKLFRRMPGGTTLDLVEPIWLQGHWWATRAQARRQHGRVVARLRQGTLPPRVQRALFPVQMFPPAAPPDAARPPVPGDFLSFLRQAAN